MRFFCTGRVVEYDQPGFEPLLQRMGKKRVEGARAVILLDVFKCQTSCGFGVPLLTTAHIATSSPDFPEVPAEPILKDRETLGHWASKQIEKNALLDYQAQNNAGSLDGLPGLGTARRDRGERLWVTGMKARVRRVAAQREALVWGMLVSVLGMWVWRAMMGGVLGALAMWVWSVVVGGVVRTVMRLLF